MHGGMRRSRPRGVQHVRLGRVPYRREATGVLSHPVVGDRVLRLHCFPHNATFEMLIETVKST